MKKVIIKNPNNPLVEANWNFFVNSEDEIIYNETWGKPERWQLASEPHDETDVLETEERDTTEVLGITNPSDDSLPSEPIYKKETWVKLKAEYTIEIEDITDKLTKEARIAELKKLLSESDFRMTNDYFLEMSDADKFVWTNQRASWRNELRRLA
jgi:hypothetical protein